MSVKRMDDKRFNERVGMALLKLCALLWEHCAIIDNKTPCELKFSDASRQMFDKDKLSATFGKSVLAVDGVVRYDQDDLTVNTSFQKDDDDSDLFFGFQIRILDVFYATSCFCKNNGCQRLLRNSVFGADSSGNYARIPKVATTPRKAAKAQVKPCKPVVTPADRLRELLLRQFRQSA